MRFCIRAFVAAVFTTMLPVVVHAQQCDIVVTGTPSVSPSPVTPGSNVTVSYVIRNIGTATAASSQTKIQIKNSSNTLITSDTFSDPSVAAGANSSTQNGTLTIPAGTPAGTYRAIVILDNLSQLNQSNESNDLTPPVNFTVGSPPAQCDIVVTGTPTVTPNPVAAGSSITVGYTIRNAGPGAAGATQTKIQIKNTSNVLITDETFSDPSIAANTNSTTQSGDVPIPADTPPGTYRAIVILDNQSVLNQSNTSNDLTPAVNFTVGAPPQQCDLFVTGTPSVSPNPVAPGSNVTVGYTLRNGGPGSAGATETKIQIKNSSGTLITDEVFSDPAVNAATNSSAQSGVVPIPTGTPAGTYSVIVIVDNQSVLDQSNTTNDFTPAITFQVEAGGTSTFQTGQRVRAAVGGARVRNSNLTQELFIQDAGVHGTLLGTPITGTAGGFTGRWWQVLWDSKPPSQGSVNGWSAESVLLPVMAAGDVAQPNLGSAPYTSGNHFWTRGEAPGTNVSWNLWPANAYGNCTWYAYGRMLEFGFPAATLNLIAPPGQAQANQWGTNGVSTAAVAAGVSVTVTPIVRSIAQTTLPVGFGHVAIVESVNTDGSITVSESSFSTSLSSTKNFLWRRRTTPASEFQRFIRIGTVSTGGSPTAVVVGESVTSGGTYMDVTVRYIDPSGSPAGIDATTVGNADVEMVCAANGYSAHGWMASQSSPAPGQIEARYRFPALNGYWDWTDNATYSIKVRSNQVRDLQGSAVASGTIKTYGLGFHHANARVGSTTVVPGGHDLRVQVKYRGYQVRLMGWHSLGSGDVELVGPVPYLGSSTLVSSTYDSLTNTYTATYSIPARGGTWDASDNGSYTLRMRQGEVYDALGYLIPPCDLKTYSLWFPPNRGDGCESIDYNADGEFGTNEDIEMFFACLAGSCPSYLPNGADFDGDGDEGTDTDVESFFRVLAGGPC